MPPDTRSRINQFYTRIRIFKTALLKWKGKWYVPHGTTATTHILKPQIADRDGRDLTRSVENEHLCMRILAQLGIPVANTEICDFEGTRALVVERFDREWTRTGRLRRRAQEDCCQALSLLPGKKYQSDGGPNMAAIFEFLKGSDDPDYDRCRKPGRGYATTLANGSIACRSRPINNEEHLEKA